MTADVVRDPKLRSLEAADRWVFVAVLALLSDQESESGELRLAKRDLCWLTDTHRIDHAKATLARVQASGLLATSYDDLGGVLTVAKWSKLQGSASGEPLSERKPERNKKATAPKEEERRTPLRHTSVAPPPPTRQVQATTPALLACPETLSEWGNLATLSSVLGITPKQLGLTAAYCLDRFVAETTTAAKTRHTLRGWRAVFRNTYRGNWGNHLNPKANGSASVPGGTKPEKNSEQVQRLLGEGRFAKDHQRRQGRGDLT